jgi:glucoamylase
MSKQKYTPNDGSLAEQYLRSNGNPISAKDLTWSYAAFLTANSARAQAMPASWGAASVCRFTIVLPRVQPLLTTLQAKAPSVCSRGSATGPCATATNTAWPGRTSTPTTPGQCSSTPTNTRVTFNERRTTNFGQTVYISGSISQLGSWDANSAIALSATQYTSSDPLWTAAINLPAGTIFAYKYLIKNQDGSIASYESDPNRSYTVPRNCAGTATQSDTWR